MKTNRPQLMQGNEACAKGALAAGVRFFAGYPITPSTEIAEIMAKELPKLGGKFIQMEDEIASIGAILGASLTGKKVLTATSGPGFSLKQELIGYGCMAEIPCVVVNVQRTGPSTGLPTGPSQGDVMQARWGTHGDHPIIVLSPASVGECYTLATRAVNLAESYMTPVILLMDEIIAHLREPVTVSELNIPEIVNRAKPTQHPDTYLPYQPNEKGVPALAPFGSGYLYHVTGLFHDEAGFPTGESKVIDRVMKRLINKVNGNADDIISWDSKQVDDAEVVIVAYGCSARSAQAAMIELRAEGHRVGLFRLITIWPFPSEQIEKIAKRVKAFIVPEMNMGQLAREVESAAGGTKVVRVNRIDGEMITPQEIIETTRGLE